MLTPFTSKKAKVDGFFRIFMGDAFNQLPDLDLDAQLLDQFPRQALFEGFVRLPFASRELPQSAQVDVGMALSDEKFALAKHEARGDVDGWHS
jgi:hypothetical protein